MKAKTLLPNRLAFGYERRKGPKHTEDAVTRWEKFRIKKPHDIVRLALSRLQRLKAYALIGFTLAAQETIGKTKKPIRATYIPEFVPQLISELEATPRSKVKKYPQKLLETPRLKF